MSHSRGQALIRPIAWPQLRRVGYGGRPADRYEGNLLGARRLWGQAATVRASELRKVAVDLPGHVALEHPDQFFLRAPFGQAALEVSLRGLVVAYAVMTMPHKAELAWRSPPRSRRSRTTLPEEAGMGATPHRCAQAASERVLPGLSPAVTSKVAAVPTPTPYTPSSSGAVFSTGRPSISSSSSFSASRASTRRPNVSRFLGQAGQARLTVVPRTAEVVDHLIHPKSLTVVLPAGSARMAEAAKY
jgi:hypothetical protein